MANPANGQSCKAFDLYRGDRFLERTGFGAIGFLCRGTVDDKKHLSADARFTPVPANNPVHVGRRTEDCVGLISHHWKGSTAPTYAAVQIIYVLRAHTARESIYVHRSDGWISRVSRQRLPKLEKKLVDVAGQGPQYFSDAHSNVSKLKQVAIDGGNVFEDWHALLPDTRGDSAGIDGRAFWHEHFEKWLPDRYRTHNGNPTVRRYETRLIQFTPTDSTSAPVVDFDFLCKDSNLLAVALRIGVATLGDPQVYYVEFD